MYVKHYHQPRRTGFTLVELLIILSIIAILVALSAAGYMRYISTQGIANTQSRLKTLDEMLQAALSKVVQDAKREDVLPAARNLAGDDRRAKVIHIKLRLMEAFPMSFAEIQNSLLYQGATPWIPANRRKYIAHYKRELGAAASVDPNTESAACLRMALQRLTTNAELDKLSLDTDGDNIQELVDDWGNALWFYRFPTNNPKLIKSALVSNKQNDKFRDPLDPEGTLLSPNWGGNNRAVFERLLHKVSPDVNLSKSYKVIPAIVSAGADWKFGLEPKTMAVQSGTAFEWDNIYQFELRIGSGTEKK